ncbi:MAG: hypothetical protein AAB455_01265, partial [Patescibacteria group bacterium]
GGTGTTYYFKFSIWDNATVASGSRLWPSSAPNSTSATVREGVFNVNIGDTANGYPDALNYDFNTNDTVYLQVEVSSDNSSFQTLSPRQLISASAFAELAARVSGTSPSSFGTTTPFTNTQVTIEATTTTAIPLAIRASSGQTANLFNIQNSAGTNLLYLNSTGGLFASSTLQATGATTLFGNLNLPAITNGCLNVTAGLVGSQACGGGAGGGSWATTTSQVAGVLINYPNNTTDIVAIGSSSTTTAKYWFDPNTGGIAYFSSPLVINNSTSTITNLTLTSATSTNFSTANLSVSGAATSSFSGGISTAGLSSS